MAVSTHTVVVDGVGTFVFRRRRIADRIGIAAAAQRIFGGDLIERFEDKEPIYHPLAQQAIILATLEALTVIAPPGWNLDNDDSMDPEVWDIIEKVFGRLRAAEETFRPGAAPGGIGAGAGAQRNDGVPVSAPIQPAAD